MKLPLTILIISLVGTCPNENMCRECTESIENKSNCLTCDRSYLNRHSKDCDEYLNLHIDNCLVYINKPKIVQMLCTSCVVGYGVHTKSNYCVKCDLEYCADCNPIIAECLACTGNRKLITDEKEKQVCSRTDQCEVDGCDVCHFQKSDGIYSCSKCKLGFSLMNGPTQKCVAAPNTNCLKVDPDGKCYSCDIGFYITDQGECFLSMFEKVNKKLLFICCLGVFLASIIKFNNWKRTSNPRNKYLITNY